MAVFTSRNFFILVGAFLAVQVVLSSPIFWLDTLSALLAHPSEALGNASLPRGLFHSAAVDATALINSNRVTVILFALLGLFGASGRLQSALLVSLAVLMVVALLVTLPVLHGVTVASTHHLIRLVSHAVVAAFGLAAVHAERVDLSEFFNSEKQGDLVLRFAINCVVVLSSFYGSMLIFGLDRFIDTMGAATAALWSTPLARKFALLLGAQTLLVNFVIFFAGRHSNRRERTLIAAICASGFALKADLAANLATQGVSYGLQLLQVGQLVHGILRNEGALTWASGGLRNTRNVLLVIVGIAFVQWATRHTTFLSVSGAGYLRNLADFLAPGPIGLYQAAHRLSGVWLSLLVAALAFGDDETIRGALGAHVLYTAIVLVFYAVHSSIFIPMGLGIFGFNAVMAVLAFSAIRSDCDGDIVSWLREDVFTKSYTPIKGGLYGAVLVFIAIAGLFFFRPQAVGIGSDNAAFATPTAQLMMTFVATTSVAFSGAVYIFTRTSGPYSSAAALAVFGAFSLSSFLVVQHQRTLVARGLSASPGAVVHSLILLALVVAGFIHHAVHNKSHAAGASASARKVGRPRAAAAAAAENREQSEEEEDDEWKEEAGEEKKKKTTPARGRRKQQ